MNLLRSCSAAARFNNLSKCSPWSGKSRSRFIAKLNDDLFKMTLSELTASRRAYPQRPRNGIIGMYGPPQRCKRKTNDGSWSALMYSASSGVNDSGP